MTHSSSTLLLASASPNDALALPPRLHCHSALLLHRLARLAHTLALTLTLALSTIFLANCGGGEAAGGSGTSSSASSGDGASLTISPATASVLLGDSATFEAHNSSGTSVSVTWSVNGIAGGNFAIGTIDSQGRYSAPTVLPSVDTLQISAVATDDSSESASASIALTSGISIEISPATSDLAFGASQQFSAEIHSSGHPNPEARWSVNGVSGGNASLGTIQAASSSEFETGDTAIYTAPTNPQADSVQVTATSVADSSKSATAVVTLKCQDAIDPPRAALALSQSLTLTATWCGGSKETTVWSVNGVTGGNSTSGVIASTGTNIASYTAPADLPSANTVSIRATQGENSASATITIESAVNVGVSPATAIVALGGRVTLTPTVTGTTDSAVTWRVNGSTGGSTQGGEICAVGSNPCSPVLQPASGPVDYLSPSSIPSPATVSVSATSRADASRGATAAITVISAGSGSISVSISPAYAFLPPAGTQQFSASVSGTGDSELIWSIQPSSTGCSGTACGSISLSGLYTAPNAAPSPNSITIQAASMADPTASATATVSLNSGPNLQQILPSSVMAGVANGFTLAVIGSGFAASTGTSASTVLVNGLARSTVCQTSLQCTITLQPADVAAAGTLTIQVQNPAPGSAASNVVPFVVVPFTLNEGIISLTAAQPESVGDDITVFEPTTAAATSSQINADYAGPITAGATCNFDSSPIEIPAPTSGSAAFSICVHGNTLDPSFFYEFSGPPSTPDISVSPLSLAGIFPNLIQLNLTLANTTTPGVRSLFITTPNNDKAVATGLLEVQP
jgi:hypothetical protein